MRADGLTCMRQLNSWSTFYHCCDSYRTHHEKQSDIEQENESIHSQESPVSLHSPTILSCRLFLAEEVLRIRVILVRLRQMVSGIHNRCYLKNCSRKKGNLFELGSLAQGNVSDMKFDHQVNDDMKVFSA